PRLPVLEGHSAQPVVSVTTPRPINTTPVVRSRVAPTFDRFNQRIILAAPSETRVNQANATPASTHPSRNVISTTFASRGTNWGTTAKKNSPIFGLRTADNNPIPPARHQRTRSDTPAVLASVVS